MKKIMFVCLGNICRSPMAEFVMKELAEKNGKAKDFVFASAATSNDEIINGVGNPVYPPARAELRRHGIDCSGKTAVRLKKEDYGKYDLFIGMDSSNIRSMLELFGGDPEGKVKKLMSFAGENADVADPWFTGDFEKAFGDISRGCAGLAEKYF